jgi:starch synthase (maltosyl-transferring)
VPPTQFDGRRRVIIEGVQPAVDDGRFPAKRVAGDVVRIEADIFADGHDLISAVALHRHAAEKKPRVTRMLPLLNDRWRAEIVVDEIGHTLFTIEAWIDHFLTWHRDLQKRGADEELALHLRIGAQMVRDAAARAKGRDRKRLQNYAAALESGESEVGTALLDLMWTYGERRFISRLDRERVIEVDRKKALFSAWYELFPRSSGAAG